MKRILCLTLVIAAAVSVFAGCQSNVGVSPGIETDPPYSTDYDGVIPGETVTETPLPGNYGDINNQSPGSGLFGMDQSGTEITGGDYEFIPGVTTTPAPSSR